MSKICCNSRRKTRRTCSTSRTKSTASTRRSNLPRPTRRKRYVPLPFLFFTSPVSPFFFLLLPSTLLFYPPLRSFPSPLFPLYLTYLHSSTFLCPPLPSSSPSTLLLCRSPPSIFALPYQLPPSPTSPSWTPLPYPLFPSTSLPSPSSSSTLLYLSLQPSATFRHSSFPLLLFFPVIYRYHLQRAVPVKTNVVKTGRFPDKPQKQYRLQISSLCFSLSSFQENLAAQYLAKVRKLTKDLEDAEDRAETAESALNKARSRARASAGGGGIGRQTSREVSRPLSPLHHKYHSYTALSPSSSLFSDSNSKYSGYY